MVNIMDIPLEEAIKDEERRLKLLKEKDPSEVFHCPVCGRYFLKLINYEEWGMCGACYAKKKTEEMKERVKHLIGGTIIDLKVEEVDPLRPEPKSPRIVQITVKTKEGKIIKLHKPKEVVYIL